MLINDYIQKSERTVLPYKEIFTALKENFIGTQITNQYILQGVIKYFGTAYNLSRDCITKDVDVNLTAEFNNFVEKNGEVITQEIKEEFISFQDHNIAMLLQRCPDVIRIDEFYLRRPESFGVTDEVILAVVENVQLAMERNGGWQSAKTFPDFEWLPRLEVSWNSFLLESIVKLSENDFKILYSFSTVGEFSTAVFVSDNFEDDDFNSFCLKILLEEQDREPFRTKEEFFYWLKENGLANRTFPKFLE